jgi:hypothetical protein
MAECKFFLSILFVLPCWFRDARPSSSIWSAQRGKREGMADDADDKCRAFSVPNRVGWATNVSSGISAWPLVLPKGAGERRVGCVKP